MSDMYISDQRPVQNLIKNKRTEKSTDPISSLKE
ncbi:hypothetical protein TNCV_3666501, partial [Trichonephila clavipes]